jgi:hypothetical protein
VVCYGSGQRASDHEKALGHIMETLVHTERLKVKDLTGTADDVMHSQPNSMSVCHSQTREPQRT